MRQRWEANLAGNGKKSQPGRSAGPEGLPGLTLVMSMKAVRFLGAP